MSTNLSDFRDDHLIHFDAEGAPPLPPGTTGTVANAGGRIWYWAGGDGPAVIFLHGGNGHAGNWNYQLPVLLEAGYHAVAIDSRGHGHSTRDDRPYSYDLMATDVIAVMDTLGIERAAIVGWSDGADTGLALAKLFPDRISGVLFFACNVDSTGTNPFVLTPELERCFSRHTKDFAAISPNPDDWKAMTEAVGLMQRTLPEYTAADLASINVPVTVLHSENEQFIKRDHAEYIAHTIPGADFVLLPEVSHFAPLQRPAAFNRVMLDFLGRLGPPA